MVQFSQSKNTLLYRNTLSFEQWSEFIRWKIVNFWEERKFRFIDNAELELFASRGNLWGNMFSANITNLKTTLAFELIEETQLCYKMEVNTSYQLITQYDLNYLNAEVEAFENYFLYNDRQKVTWRDAFAKNSTKANFLQ